MIRRHNYSVAHKRMLVTPAAWVQARLWGDFVSRLQHWRLFIDFVAHTCVTRRLWVGSKKPIEDNMLLGRDHLQCHYILWMFMYSIYCDTQGILVRSLQILRLWIERSWVWVSVAAVWPCYWARHSIYMWILSGTWLDMHAVINLFVCLNLVLMLWWQQGWMYAPRGVDGVGTRENRSYNHGKM